MEDTICEKETERLTIQEYLDKRNQIRKSEEQTGKLLTKFEWNVMIHE